MKKILVMLLAAMMVLSLAACGDETVPTGNDLSSTNISSGTNDTSSASDTQIEESSSQEEITSSSDDTEWKQFLKDYEAWVDSYIEILKKYEENPADMSILADYTEMLAEITDWAEKADKIEAELEDSPEAELEYAAELARIAGKLADAAY